VAGFSIEELGALTRRHRADDTIGKAIRSDSPRRPDHGPRHWHAAVGKDAAECFYRMVDVHYKNARGCSNTDAEQGHGSRFFPW
jgi:hypothetical protein